MNLTHHLILVPEFSCETHIKVWKDFCQGIGT